MPSRAVIYFLILLLVPGHGLLRAVEIDFVGNQKFNDGDLRGAIAYQLEDIDQYGLAPASADDAAFFLGLFYRKNGYAHIAVKWNIPSPGRLALEISEGPRVELGTVRVTGLDELDQAKLVEFVIGPTRERFSLFRDAKELPFALQDLQTGVANLRGYVESEGYISASVGLPVVTFFKDKSEADVEVPVVPGLRHRFGKIEFEGDLVFYPDEPLRETIRPFTEAPFTNWTLISMARAVGYFYKSRGYFNAKVETVCDPALAVNGEVPVKFVVTSGDVFRFGGLKVEGLDRLSESFLPSRFKKLKGAFYNPDKLDTLFRDLMRTGLFKRLQIDPQATENGEVEMHLTVEEALAKELGFLLGFGSFEGPFAGISVGDRNLFGNGRPLSGTLEWSARFFKGEVLYLDPWFLETANTLRSRLYGVTYDYDGYTKNEYGLRLELSRQLSPKLNASAFTQTRRASITSTGIKEPDLGPTRYALASVGITQTMDHRDSILNPRKGWVLSSALELAGSPTGDDVQFLRGSLRFSLYLPVAKRSLIALGFRTGFIQNFGGPVPIDERFFNGGSRSVRSFPERELGPKDKGGHPIGGLAFTTLNAEFVFPLWKAIDGAFFIDAGSVSDDWGAALGDLHFAVGFGIRYMLPVGPIRLDYGWNPAPQGDDPFGTVQLSIGFAF